MTLRPRERQTRERKSKENNRYAIAAARVFTHGEPVIGLKLNLTMDGGTRKGHFIHTSDTLWSIALGHLQ